MASAAGAAPQAGAAFAGWPGAGRRGGSPGPAGVARRGGPPGLGGVPCRGPAPGLGGVARRGGPPGLGGVACRGPAPGLAGVAGRGGPPGLGGTSRLGPAQGPGRPGGVIGGTVVRSRPRLAGRRAGGRAEGLGQLDGNGLVRLHRQVHRCRRGRRHRRGRSTLCPGGRVSGPPYAPYPPGVPGAGLDAPGDGPPGAPASGVSGEPGTGRRGRTGMKMFPWPGASGSGPTAPSIRAAVAASGRSAGLRCSRALMTGPSPAADGADGGSELMMADIVVMAPPARSKGPCPSTAAYRVAPSDHRSNAGVAGLPWMRSGAVKPGDPMTMPVWVSFGSPSKVAMPKSVSTARPPSASSTLLGFTSRCSTPAAWAVASAASSMRPASAARCGGSGPSLRDDLVQRACRDELHDDPRAPVLLGHVEDGDDAGVTEPRRGSGLAMGPLVGLGAFVRGQAVADAQFLDGDLAAEDLVPRAPHRAHRTPADGLLKAVAPRYDAPRARHSVHSRTIHGISR